MIDPFTHLRNTFCLSSFQENDNNSFIINYALPMNLQSFIWASVYNKSKVITVCVYQKETGKNVCDKNQIYKMLEKLIKISKIFLVEFNSHQTYKPDSQCKFSLY